VIFLTPILSAVFAAALMPVTARVLSRPSSVRPWVSLPIAVVVSSGLAWSSARLFEPNPVFVAGLAVACAVLGTQIAIDLCVRRLLRELSYGGLIIFAGSAAFQDPGDASGFTGLVVGAIVMVVVAGVLVLVSRGALGLGDLHLAPLLGALVGWFAPGAVIFSWMITAFAGALFTTFGLLSKRLTRESMIPYGPFMVFGSIVSILVIAIRS
jgi:prepilin signal peptidase PulO-like enzyme (type II secretory pathway)